MRKKIYIHEDDYDKSFKDKEGEIWGYYSRKKIKKLYPDGGESEIKIVGEIAEKNRNEDYVLEDDNNKILKLGPVGYHKKRINRIAGYIRCGEDEYIAVMKKNWIMFFLILLGIAAITIGVIYFSNMNKGPKLDANAKDYVSKLEKPDNWDPTKIAVPGYPDFVIKEGDEFAYVALSNPDFNPVYFKFEVIMTDTNELLYETDLIPPGKAVTQIPIKKGLKSGKYDLTIKVKSYSLDDHTKSMNGANISTQLIVMK